MKAYGYIQHPNIKDGPSLLSEVSFQASPEELREIASFMLAAATQMEVQGLAFDHCHLQDKHPGRFSDKECPEVIVARPA